MTRLVRRRKANSRLSALGLVEELLIQLVPIDGANTGGPSDERNGRSCARTDDVVEVRFPGGASSMEATSASSSTVRQRRTRNLDLRSDLDATPRRRHRAAPSATGHLPAPTADVPDHRGIQIGSADRCDERCPPERRLAWTGLCWAGLGADGCGDRSIGSRRAVDPRALSLIESLRVKDQHSEQGAVLLARHPRSWLLASAIYPKTVRVCPRRRPCGSSPAVGPEQPAPCRRGRRTTGRLS